MEIVRVSEMSRIAKAKCESYIRFFLMDLCLEYPLHNIWYEKMIKSMEEKSDREILAVFENDILLGTAILKNTVDEKKICTFRVKSNYQKRGIGKQLMLKSFEYLETDKPIITVSQQKNHEFKRLLDFFGFNLESIYWGKYVKGSTEFVYNGILLPETLLEDELKSDKQGGCLKVVGKTIVA